MDLFGFLNINKPEGITSHDVISKLRKKLNIKKIGHSGTLDPFASGVLPVAVSSTTRLLRFLPETKAYEAIVDLRYTTDTDDLSGEKLEDIHKQKLDLDEIKSKLAAMHGDFEQLPPLYSAIKIKGKKLYEMMRNGEDLSLEDIKKRKVHIKEINILDYKFPLLHISISCKAGVYIRSIARDLGGHLKKLIRSESNSLLIENSVDLDAINLDTVHKHFINPTRLISIPKLRLDAKKSIEIQQGKFLSLENSLNFGQELIQCIGESDEFIGIASVAPQDSGKVLVKPKVII